MISFSKKRKPGIRRAKRRPRTSGEKNGRLILALSGALLMMMTLVYIVSGLVGDQDKDQKTSDAITIEQQDKKSQEAKKEPSKGEPNSSRPKIMFYEELENQEDTKQSKDQNEPQSQGQVKTNTHQAPGLADQMQAPKNARDSRKTTTRPRDRRGLHRPEPRTSRKMDPRPDRSKGQQPFYTVQVGAFSNPSLAQQWAKQWEDRGFKVTIKPVARPRTGVLYRLFLGEFNNKEDADSLVKRLKDNEGITALRLLVRN